LFVSFTYHENPTSRRCAAANGISLSSVAFANKTSHLEVESTHRSAVNALEKQLQLNGFCIKISILGCDAMQFGR
jgi:hypothetical protein